MYFRRKNSIFQSKNNLNSFLRFNKANLINQKRLWN